MVFEQLFQLRWIERREHAVFLGFIYTIIGLVSARLIFPSNAGLMSVAFTSILLIPPLNLLLSKGENVEIREKKLSLTQLFKDHKDIFKVYLFLFLGVFLSYGLLSLLISEPNIQKMFAPQLKSAGVSGFAAQYHPLFGIIINNMLVFVVCFVLSLIYGAGSVLFLTWNASVWGTVFGFFVRQSASLNSSNVFSDFVHAVIPFLPHMTTEALAYISAAIVGGIVSKAVLREKLFSKRFHHIITDALIFLVIGLVLVITAGIIEVGLYQV